MLKPTIGLEVHVQLKTRSKMFCSCPVEFKAEPNTLVCPVCLGLPGSLPVLNRQAVEYTIAVALALHCEIQPFSQFHRKNYFYPDLPKGYQISQYDLPFSRNGYLIIETEEGEKRIGIQRVHMEEDTAKMIHGESISRTSGYSLIDFNRSGVPLLEIVSRPDISSPQEATLYLMELRSILRTLGVSTANMEEGALRCDVNISLERGTRTEIKNLNSFHSVRKALEYEIKRQEEVLKEKGQVIQETRHYDERAGVTLSMRTKEEAEDYRYFPEPDLVPLKIDPSWIEEVRSRMPELPEDKRKRYKELGLFPQEAATIANNPELANFFDSCLSLGAPGKEVANWLLSEVMKYLNARNLSIIEVPLSPEGLVEFLTVLKEGTISSKIGKMVIEEMLQTGDGAREIIERKGLAQISDPVLIKKWAEEVIKENPDQVSQYRQGKEQLFGFFVGKVMKLSGGKANPEILNRILKELLLRE
ncbi:MAG: Asp-tRNA(Asn)/Glu-tRNA(Gln) amidotransferase subunit GatB [Coprothermobacterota bacterium]|nr:Asp-tRNA(Asn)/Glu-tRNA(Gln) amidotransferase subunit GatB [Coprothermobacterota bacterium]